MGPGSQFRVSPIGAQQFLILTQLVQLNPSPPPVQHLVSDHRDTLLSYGSSLLALDQTGEKKELQLS